jgi:hypothetical protein
MKPSSGSFTIESVEEKGTIIHASWPLNEDRQIEAVVWAADNGVDLGEDEICCER